MCHETDVVKSMLISLNYTDPDSYFVSYMFAKKFNMGYYHYTGIRDRLSELTPCRDEGSSKLYYVYKNQPEYSPI